MIVPAATPTPTMTPPLATNPFSQFGGSTTTPAVPTTMPPFSPMPVPPNGTEMHGLLPNGTMSLGQLTGDAPVGGGLGAQPSGAVNPGGADYQPWQTTAPGIIGDQLRKRPTMGGGGPASVLPDWIRGTGGMAV